MIKKISLPVRRKEPIITYDNRFFLAFNKSRNQQYELNIIPVYMDDSYEDPISF